MQKIKNPSNKLLIIFGIFLVLPIAFLIYVLSFKWFPPFEFYIFIIYIFTIIFIIIFKIIDYKLKSKFTSFLYVFIFIFTLVYLISMPIKKWQKNESEKIGNKLIKIIDIYKEDVNAYPDSLTDLVDKGYIMGIPRTRIGTKFFYETLYNGHKYKLYFKTYDGMWGEFSHNNQKWIYYD